MTQTTAHTSASAKPAQSRETLPSDETGDHSLTESADRAFQSVSELYDEVNLIVQKRARDNPYATLGVAAGVGFVLGGGLASPLGQTLLRLSIRAFGPPIVNALVTNTLEQTRSNLQSPRT